MKISSIFPESTGSCKLIFEFMAVIRFFDTYLANFLETEQNVISDLATDNMKKHGSLKLWHNFEL